MHIFGSLVSLFVTWLTPKFVKFWHKSKNKLTVFQVRPTYAVPTWWECNKGHTFRKSPGNVTKNNKFVCSICDSIKYSCTKLMKEWDWEKNSEDPSKLSPGSGKRVFCARQMANKPTDYIVRITKCNN